MKLMLFILTLLFAAEIPAQNEYVIRARVNGMFFYDDNSVVMHIHDMSIFDIADNATGKSQTIKKGKWSFEIKEKNSGYRLVKEGKGDPFIIDTDSLHFGDDSYMGNLDRKIFPGNTSVYYPGLVRFEGELLSGEKVADELQILFNILPSIPIVEVLDLSWSNYDEKYHIYDDGNMVLKIQSERCSRILISEEIPYEGGGLDKYFQSDIDPVNNIGNWEFWDGDSYFLFTACNKYGVTTSKDTLWVSKTVSVSTTIKDDIQFYPNPVVDLLHIEGEIENIASITVYDMKGQTVRQIDRISPVIDFTDLQSGFYYLVCTDKKEIKKTIKKIIKR